MLNARREADDAVPVVTLPFRLMLPVKECVPPNWTGLMMPAGLFATMLTSVPARPPANVVVILVVVGSVSELKLSVLPPVPVNVTAPAAEVPFKVMAPAVMAPLIVTLPPAPLNWASLPWTQVLSETLTPSHHFADVVSQIPAPPRPAPVVASLPAAVPSL